MLNIDVREGQVLICVLPGKSEVENLQWLINSGNESSLEFIREANKKFREMPIVVLDAVIKFCEAKCEQYAWFQIGLTDDSWAGRYEEDNIIYDAHFDWNTNIIEWDPCQVILVED